MPSIGVNPNLDFCAMLMKTQELIGILGFQLLLRVKWLRNMQGLSFAHLLEVKYSGHLLEGSTSSYIPSILPGQM